MTLSDFFFLLPVVFLLLMLVYFTIMIFDVIKKYTCAYVHLKWLLNISNKGYFIFYFHSLNQNVGTVCIHS